MHVCSGECPNGYNYMPKFLCSWSLWFTIVFYYKCIFFIAGSNSDLHKLELPGTNVHAYEK